MSSPSPSTRVACPRFSPSRTISSSRAALTSTPTGPLVLSPIFLYSYYTYLSLSPPLLLLLRPTRPNRVSVRLFPLVFPTTSVTSPDALPHLRIRTEILSDPVPLYHYLDAVSFAICVCDAFVYPYTRLRKPRTIIDSIAKLRKSALSRKLGIPRTFDGKQLVYNIIDNFAR